MLTGTSNVTQTPTTLLSTSTSGTGSLDKDAFLKLLVTQLQNQDPLKPMDDTQFVSQLAQFSSLEQMQTLNSSVAPFAKNFDLFAANQDAANMIGRTITATDPNPPKDGIGKLITPQRDSNGNPLLDATGKQVPVNVTAKVDSVKFTPDGPQLVVKVTQKELDSSTGKLVDREEIKQIPVANVLSVTQ